MTDNEIVKFEQEVEEISLITFGVSPFNQVEE